MDIIILTRTTRIIMLRSIYACWLFNLALCYIIICYIVNDVLNGHNNEQVIVLLGCDNPQFQDQRIQTVLNYTQIQLAEF